MVITHWGMVRIHCSGLNGPFQNVCTVQAYLCQVKAHEGIIDSSNPLRDVLGLFPNFNTKWHRNFIGLDRKSEI